MSYPRRSTIDIAGMIAAGFAAAVRVAVAALLALVLFSLLLTWTGILVLAAGASVAWRLSHEKRTQPKAIA